MRSTRVTTTVFAILALGVAAAFGCSGKGSGTASAKLHEGVRSQAIEHEACSEGGHKVEQVDVNNDGKADIKRVFDGNREVCRISDLNHDGKPDMFEYYDETGQLRRREADYDDNGVVNAVEIYEHGKLVRAELDITNQGRIDTWDTFDPSTGKRLKRERDTTGDGRVDQWWTYEGEKITIATDKNGDGKPDPQSVITLGSNQAPPGSPPPDAGALPPPPAAPTAPSSPTSPAPPGGAADAGPPKRGGAKR